ncbi:MAG: hypothetical protein ACI4SA_05020 [Lachnospiraceae bacterium]
MEKKIFSKQNVNLFTALLVFLILTGIAALFLVGIQSAIESVQNLGNQVQNDLQRDEIGEEGWGILINGFAYLVGTIAIGIVKLILWVIIIYHCFLMLLAGILRLIFSRTAGRLLAYRILTGFYCFFLAIEAVILMLTQNIGTIIAGCSIVFVIVVTMINTYSHIEVISKNGIPPQNAPYYTG